MDDNIKAAILDLANLTHVTEFGGEGENIGFIFPQDDVFHAFDFAGRPIGTYANLAAANAALRAEHDRIGGAE